VVKSSLSRKLLDDPDFLLRFQNEASSTGRIHHVNVVTIYESGQADDSTPYIAMEFLEGESLRQAPARRGTPMDRRENAKRGAAGKAAGPECGPCATSDALRGSRLVQERFSHRIRVSSNHRQVGAHRAFRTPAPAITAPPIPLRTFQRA